MKTHLCKCNNCGNILYDENPRIGAKELETESFGIMLPMELLNEDGESFWGCSECETDAYLTDL